MMAAPTGVATVMACSMVTVDWVTLMVLAVHVHGAAGGHAWAVAAAFSAVPAMTWTTTTMITTVVVTATVAGVTAPATAPTSAFLRSWKQEGSVEE